MQISKLSAVNNAYSNITFGRKQQKTAQKNSPDIFEQYAPQKLPANKAIKIGYRPGISLLNILLLPFGFLGFSIKPSLKLVDIDKDSLTKKEQRLIRKGKMIDYVPLGYHIEGTKVKKNR